MYRQTSQSAGDHFQINPLMNISKTYFTAKKRPKVLCTVSAQHGTVGSQWFTDTPGYHLDMGRVFKESQLENSVDDISSRHKHKCGEKGVKKIAHSTSATCKWVYFLKYWWHTKFAFGSVAKEAQTTEFRQQNTVFAALHSAQRMRLALVAKKD